MSAPAPPPASREEARSAKVEVTQLLAGAEGVVGVGLERLPDGGWSVRVNVTSAQVAQAVGEQVPAGRRSVPVRVQITGTIEATSEVGEERSDTGANGPTD